MSISSRTAPFFALESSPRTTNIDALVVNPRLRPQSRSARPEISSADNKNLLVHRHRNRAVMLLGTVAMGFLSYSILRPNISTNESRNIKHQTIPVGASDVTIQTVDANEVATFQAIAEPKAKSVSMDKHSMHELPRETLHQLDKQLSAIRALQPIYESVANKAGLPWQAIAALDYRESSNDPLRSVFAGELIGTINPDHGDIKGHTKQENLLLGAEFFKHQARAVYGVDLKARPTRSDLEMAFVAYNRGYMYKQVGQLPSTSPYVMNGFDENHINMTWPNNVSEPGITKGQSNHQLGALTVMAGLGYELH